MTQNCRTPGTIYKINIDAVSGSTFIQSVIILPHNLNLTETTAAELEDKIHDALEDILAPFFSRSFTGQSTAEMGQ